MQDVDEEMEAFMNKSIRRESLPAIESATKPSPIKCEPPDYPEDASLEHPPKIKVELPSKIKVEQPPKIKVEPAAKIKTEQPIGTTTTLKVKNENENVLFENKPLDFGMTPERISSAMKRELGDVEEEKGRGQGQRSSLKSAKKSVFHKERPYEKQKAPGKEG